jgi:NAD(P)-dependent dehydrogenase (short-subunit alcohol dehydrogenase family)
MPTKVFVVTSATSGIGRALAMDLAKAGETVGTEAHAYAHDQDPQQRLWEVSEQLTGLAATKGVTAVNDSHLG